jgi:hypothetical protein
MCVWLTAFLADDLMVSSHFSTVDVNQETTANPQQEMIL